MRITTVVHMKMLATASFVFLSTLTAITAFSPSPAFLANRMRTTTTNSCCPRNKNTITLQMAVSESGVETGVIKGIQEDSDEIDFGRCGVKLAEDTAVRMSGPVTTPGTMTATAEWREIDNIVKLTPASGAHVDMIPEIVILGKASAVEDYKDPGQGIIKEVRYAPDECAKEILKLGSDLSPPGWTKRIVINVAGGNDLMVSEVSDAVVKVSAGLEKTIPIVWNSVSYKEFANGEASMVVVAVGNGEDGSGEIYFQNGKYWTVDENDIISDFSEDWMH